MISTAAADDALVAAAKAKDSAAALALIQREVDVNYAEPDGTTPLHWAVHYGDRALVEKLLAAGADVTATNDYGATPMSEAAVVGDAAILEALIVAGAGADAPNAEGQTALMVVARSSNVDAAQVLLAHGADVNAREERKGQTALMWAAAQSQPAMVDLLIANGATVNDRSRINEWERQVTAEPRAKHLPSGGFTPLLYAAREGCLDCARSLVTAGADIDMADPDGISPLLSALLNAHFDTAKYLLEAGANPNKWDWWGRNPLYAAIDYNTLPHGGRPDRPSLDQTTPLQMAELLLDKGANPNLQLKLFPPYRSLRMDRGGDTLLDIGTTPLLRAARAADIEAMRLLIARGALVDLPQMIGVTPLMAVSGLGAGASDTRGKFKTEIQSIEAAGVLLDAGADVNARNEIGQTAAHAAAAQGYTDLVSFLAERGADLAAVDAERISVLDAALGKMRSRRNTAAAVHEDTAALIRERLASAPSQ